MVMGAGAIGSLYGGLLSQAGADVTLVGRPIHMNAISSNGLRLKGLVGDHTSYPEARTTANGIDHADFVFVTTKAYDTHTAVRDIRHLSDSGAYVLVLQNGLDSEIAAAEILQTRRVLRATTCMGAVVTAPGEVTVTGLGLTEIGTHYPENRPQMEQVADLLRYASLEVRLSDNVDGLVWTKTIVNCGLNPVAALTGLRNGELYNNPLLRRLVVRLVEEATAVAMAMGVKLTTDDPVRYTLGTAKATFQNINSMLQDLLNGRRTEIDAISGSVIRLARQFDVPVPVTESVYALVRAIESTIIADRSRRRIPFMTVPELASAITSY
ncbi:MAG: ketopantoate reductase family protein [Candidatus Thorarchaeota archaeon]